MGERRLYEIAVRGGTGAQGSAVALRLAAAGHEVTIGSRDAAKARAAGVELSACAGKTIAGSDNSTAAGAAQIVFLTVPYSAQAATATALFDVLHEKILVDATVPLATDKPARVQLPQGRSAVATLQELAGSAVRVVSALQNVSAAHLRDRQHPVPCDVLVCGNDPAARDIVIGLCADM